MDSTILIERGKTGELDILLRLYVALFHGRELLTQCFGVSKERMLSVVQKSRIFTCRNRLNCYFSNG
jgi:hypothetical protein